MAAILEAEPPPGAAAPAQPAWTLLCVDDEPHIVSALRRLFRGSGFRVLGAHGGAEALSVLERESVDVVLSDMRMPGMDGAQLLQCVRAQWPSVSRLLLTGYADVKSTVAAINDGGVQRYITKPWSDDELLLTVRDAFERQALEGERRRLEALTRRQNAELSSLNGALEQRVAERTRELSRANDRLRKTYLTSIKAFSNLIELRGGAMVGHARRVADTARRTARAMDMGEGDAQTLFVAGLLHDIGQIGLPDTMLSRSLPRYCDEERSLYRRHPAMGEQALMALDELQPVAMLIRAHHERHDGKGFPDGLQGDAIPLGARILGLAEHYDDLQTGHAATAALKPSEALTLISRARGSAFHPEVVDVFLQLTMGATPKAADPPVPMLTGQLAGGMVLAHELRSCEGVMLLAAGHVLTPDLIARIRHYELREKIILTLHVQP